jgi:hypothetical protein
MVILNLRPKCFQWYLTETVYKDELNLTRYIGMIHEVWIRVLKEKRYSEQSDSYIHLWFNYGI